MSNEDQNKLDIALTRASHLSQILLVLFAIFGYFYTVRPIHQNQVLSEKISRKEMQLKKFQHELKEKVADATALTSEIKNLKSRRGEEERNVERLKDRVASLKNSAKRAQSKLFDLNSRVSKLYNSIYVENMSGSAARILSLNLDDFNKALFDETNFDKARSLLPISVYSAITELLSRSDPIIVAQAKDVPDQRKELIKAVIERLQKKYRSRLSSTDAARKSLLRKMQNASGASQYELYSGYREKFWKITEQDFDLISWFFGKVSEEIKANEDKRS
ncbi:hypothetical protein [Salinisphaera sp. T31B1]|uniref:hypothetical protein n=1 Tax=Salinisphaera sp. T31B1 TaxID=727963 RepID=UPI00333F55F5